MMEKRRGPTPPVDADAVARQPGWPATRSWRGDEVLARRRDCTALDAVEKLLEEALQREREHATVVKDAVAGVIGREVDKANNDRGCGAAARGGRRAQVAPTVAPRPGCCASVG